METKDRIRMIMEDLHMTQQVFADFIQQAPATLSSIFNGRTRPTLNVIDAIKVKIPNISIEWLLYGTGEMYITHPATENPPSPEVVSAPTEQTLNFDSPVLETQPSSSSTSLSSFSQHGVKTTPSEFVREEIKIVDKAPRKVTEIRVYYDDQTYESFVPAKK
jgi:transcriptional regulator with XRE-family HTH domain